MSVMNIYERARKVSALFCSIGTQNGPVICPGMTGETSASAALRT